MTYEAALAPSCCIFNGQTDWKLNAGCANKKNVQSCECWLKSIEDTFIVIFVDYSYVAYTILCTIHTYTPGT